MHGRSGTKGGQVAHGRTWGASRSILHLIFILLLFQEIGYTVQVF